MRTIKLACIAGIAMLFLWNISFAADCNSGNTSAVSGSIMRYEKYQK